MGKLNLNLFLPHTPIYTDNDKDKFLKDLNEIAQKDKFSFLKVTDSGRVIQSKNIFDWLYNQFQGLRGNFDGTNRDLIQYQTVKIINEGMRKGWIDAKNQGLVPLAITSVKRHNGIDPPELDAFVKNLGEERIRQSNAVSQEYYCSHRADLIPRKWTSSVDRQEEKIVQDAVRSTFEVDVFYAVPQQALQSILENHYLLTHDLSKFDESLHPFINDLKEVIKEMKEELEEQPMSDETFKKFLENHERIQKVEERLYDFVQQEGALLGKTIKLPSSSRKDWGELYILTTSLIQWGTNYRDMHFYKQVSQELSKQTPLSKEAINALEICAEFSREQLLQLNRYIRKPSDFFKGAVLVPSMDDSIHYITQSARVSSSSFERDLVREVPNLLKNDHGVVKGLNPMEKIAQALVQLGFSNVRMEELLHETHKLMEHKKDHEAIQLLTGAIKNTDERLASSEYCREQLIESIKATWSLAKTRGILSIPFHELIDGFPKLEDIPREEWNQLMDVDPLDWEELTLLRSKTSKSWTELIETFYA